ncbi:Ubiquinone biosynthesis monooxygenase UbiB [Streptococcus sp. HSISB1]|nr:Ubiquinone biosynthesis monooxygenase UbiB [Streptococcus sp. HSISB1]
MSGRRLREIIGAFSSVGLTSIIEKEKQQKISQRQENYVLLLKN